jgi:hypothetical protein
MKDRKESVFSGNVLRLFLVLALAMVAFALVTAFLVPTIKGNEPSGQTNDSYNRKAVGYRAFVDLMKAMKVQVLRLRNASAYRRSSSPIVFIAPNPKIRIATQTPKLVDVLKARSKAGHPSLLVLPKWKVRQEIGRRKAEPLSDFAVTLLVRSLIPGLQTELVKDSAHLTPVDFKVSHPVWGSYKLASARPQFLAFPRYRYVTFQTLKLEEGKLELIFGTTEKALLLAYTPSWKKPKSKSLFSTPLPRPAKARKVGKIYILTDPDLLANYNLQRAENASFAYGMVSRVLNSKMVLLDEVFHGHHQLYSIVAELRKFPNFLFVIQLLLVLVVVTWAGFRRFGVPLSADRVMERGPKEIIEITAWVLTCGLKVPTLAGNYVKAILNDTIARLELKNDKKKTAMERLDNLAQAQGLELVPSELYAASERFHNLESRSSKEALRLAHKAWYLRHQLLTQRWKA